MQKEACGCLSCKDGGVIPDSGFPRVDDMANEELTMTIEHGANTSISCIANIGSRRVISAAIPPKRAVRSGVEEVDVLVTVVVEVVVHVHFRRGT